MNRHIFNLAIGAVILLVVSILYLLGIIRL